MMTVEQLEAAQSAINRLNHIIDDLAEQSLPTINLAEQQADLLNMIYDEAQQDEDFQQRRTEHPELFKDYVRYRTWKDLGERLEIAKAKA